MVEKIKEGIKQIDLLDNHVRAKLAGPGTRDHIQTSVGGW